VKTLRSRETSPAKESAGTPENHRRNNRLGATAGRSQAPHQEFITIDTTNVLFIVGGAFAGLDKIVEARMGKKSLGFTFDIVEGEREAGKDISTDVYSHVMPEDLIKFGMIPEFIGRLPVFTAVNKLDREALVAVLTEPKNALIKQYQKLFELDSIELEFEPEALDDQMGQVGEALSIAAHQNRAKEGK